MIGRVLRLGVAYVFYGISTLVGYLMPYPFSIYIYIYIYKICMWIVCN